MTIITIIYEPEEVLVLYYNKLMFYGVALTDKHIIHYNETENLHGV